MIELKNVSKVFTTKKGNVEALKSTSLQVKKGEVFGIIGYSGAGKSTLIRCVNLLEKPTTGNIIVNSQDLTTLSAKELAKARQKIGMIFQGFNLLKTVTVYENIALPLRLAGIPKVEIEKKSRKVFTHCRSFLLERMPIQVNFLVARNNVLPLHVHYHMNLKCY